jgi:hypothetical protein
MQMVNFNDLVYAFQEGGDPLVYGGTSFAPHTPTNIAKGNAALSAFGRIWASDDTGTFLQYSALLNGDEWDYLGNAGAGGFELRHVWEGVDTIQAIREFNGTLVVFGANNIVVWSDGQGSELGMDPNSMYVVDITHGLGCYARDSVVEVDGDMWFLADSGIHSLSRVVEQRSNPLDNLSKYVHDELMARARNTYYKDIKAVYSPEERFVLFSFPDGSVGEETGSAYCFDSRSRLEDGAAICIGKWSTLVPKSMVRHTERKELLMFCGIANPAGVLVRSFSDNACGVYAGYIDPRAETSDPIVPYQMRYATGWSDFGVPYMKITKRLRSTMYVLGESEVSFQIWYDFNNFAYSTPTAVKVGEGSSTDYWTNPQSGTGVFLPVDEGIEWSDDPGGVDAQAAKAGEWASTAVPVIVSVPGIGGTGEYVKLGVQARIAGSQLSLQELSLYTKQGRLV